MRYAPRRPEASPLYRIHADYVAALERVHDGRFEPTHGPPRFAAHTAVGHFLDCGLLEHGFARVRCATCHAEFLAAFRCTGRHFCPSCHARRLAAWSLWLDEQLFFRVPLAGLCNAPPSPDGYRRMAARAASAFGEQVRSLHIIAT